MGKEKTTGSPLRKLFAGDIASDKASDKAGYYASDIASAIAGDELSACLFVPPESSYGREIGGVEEGNHDFSFPPFSPFQLVCGKGRS